MKKKVFISGSIAIKSFDSLVVDSLKKIAANQLEVLVGDAPGIDTLVQNFFRSNNYTDVTIYSIERSPRYSADNKFKMKYIEVSNDVKKERERQSYKDLAMSEDADYSLVIWDGKSKGSYSNIVRALEMEKMVKVFYTQINTFLDPTDLSLENITFIYRENNGYTASEVLEQLNENGVNIFNRTQDFNKFLLEKQVLMKDKDGYLPLAKFEDYFIVEKYKGKRGQLKFKNEFFDWLENNLSLNKQQGELF